MCFKSLVESKSKIPRIINKIANAINLFRFVFFIYIMRLEIKCMF